MCCSRWHCTGIVAAVCREASRLRLQIYWDSRFSVVLSMRPINHLLQPSRLHRPGQRCFTKETGGGKQAQYLVVLAWQERDASRKARKGNESAEANTRSAEARGSTRKRHMISSQFGLLILITAQLVALPAEVPWVQSLGLVWNASGFTQAHATEALIETPPGTALKDRVLISHFPIRNHDS